MPASSVSPRNANQNKTICKWRNECRRYGSSKEANKQKKTRVNLVGTNVVRARGLNGGFLFREEKRERKVRGRFWLGPLDVRNARNSRFFQDLIFFKKRGGGRTGLCAMS